MEAIPRRAADYIPGVFREVVDDLIDRERRANATHYRTTTAPTVFVVHALAFICAGGSPSTTSHERPAHAGRRSR